MSIQEEMLVIGGGWIALVVLLLFLLRHSSFGSTGLPLAYVLATTLLYIGGFGYAVPGYTHMRFDGSAYLRGYDFTEQTVLAGMLASLLGMAGFVAGCALREKARLRLPAPGGVAEPAVQARTIMTLAAIGACGFLLGILQLSFPLAQALFQAMQGVGIAAICIGLLFAYRSRNSMAYWGWFAAATALPVIHVLAFGFVSSGFIMFTIFTGFWLTVLRGRRVGTLAFLAGGAAVTYLILSVFVTWMAIRTELRDADELEGRIDVLSRAVDHVGLLSLNNFASLDWVNSRLNQYIFVGKAIEHHERIPDLRLNGQSLIYIPLVWVPRFLWPGKPEMGGNAMVSQHTGMRFSEHTTFGAGQILELFANFGHMGIFFGCLVFGYVLRWIDQRASLELRSGKLLGFTIWFCVGLPMIAPLAEMFFVANSMMMAMLLLSILARFMGSDSARMGMPQTARPTWPIRKP